MWRTESKICLPIYKVACSLCFVVILSLVRGISSTGEIGITLDTGMPILAIVFCCDAYQMEYSGKRWEVFRLYSVKNRTAAMLKRLAIQVLYLCAATVLGYLCFFWQRPVSVEGISDSLLFFLSIGSAAVSICFFGITALTLANLTKNSWYGIGASLVLWLCLNSVKGAAFFGKYNVFSFVFREISDSTDYSWLCGKGASAALSAAMLAGLPRIIRKRG